MAWTGVITNIGKDMLSQWVAGAALNVTGAAAGSGTVAEAALVNQTALVSHKQEMSIVAGAVVPQGRRIKLQITAPETGYTLNQIGVFAGVGSANPVLMALYQNEDGINVPSQTEEETFTFTFYAVIATDNTGELNLTIDSEALVTHETMEEYVAEAIADKADLVGGKVPVAQIPDLEYAPKYNAATSYPADSYCIHKGYLWRNTSGTSATGVEPGTNYNVWNVGFSNDNLLDNWDFTNPVNQRGASGLVSSGYGLDRWSGAGGGYTINEKSVSSSGGYALQFLDRALESGAYTASLLVGAGSHAFYEFGTWGGSKQSNLTDSTNGGIVSFTFNLNMGDYTKLPYVYIGNNQQASNCVIYKAKLEPGPISTLANDIEIDLQMEKIKCSLSTVDPGDDYANGKRTAQLVGGINRNGDTYSGIVNHSEDGIGKTFILGHSTGGFVGYFRGDYSKRRYIGIEPVETHPDNNTAFVFGSAYTGEAHYAMHSGNIGTAECGYAKNQSFAATTYADGSYLRNAELRPYEYSPAINGSICWQFG